MNKYLLASILALSLTASAQQPTDKQKIAALQMQLSMSHLKDAYQEHAAAIAELEAAYPGTKWDEQRQTLVPVQAKAEPQIDKKAAK